MIVVAIVPGLAAFLIWRNMQAGRRVAAAATRQQALEGRTRAFVDLPGTLPAITRWRACSERAKAPHRLRRRARVDLAPEWRWRTLRCDDCYEAAAKDHTSALPCTATTSDLFAALDKGR